MKMKKILSFVFAALLLLVLVANSFAQMPHHTLTWQGYEREYIVYVPSNYDASHTRGVLVGLHGLYNDIDSLKSMTNMAEFVELTGWIGVTPQALPYSANIGIIPLSLGNTWNSGASLRILGTTYEPNSDIDDSGFLMALVDTLIAQYNIDSDSVYFTGMSMGGFMTNRMAIEHSDRIAGAASVSGLIPLRYETAVPPRKISFMHVHGTSDNVVTYDGKMILGSFSNLQVGLGAEQTVEFWRSFNQCDVDAIVDTLPHVGNDFLFQRHLYLDGINGTKVEFLRVENGEHHWYGGDDLPDIDFLFEIYEFFTGRRIYQGTPTQLDMQETMRAHIFPNPARGQFVVYVPQFVGKLNITVYDAVGHEIISEQSDSQYSTVDLQSLTAGAYFVRVASDCGVVVKKLMVE